VWLFNWISKKIAIPNADPGPPPAGKISNQNSLMVLWLALLLVLLLLSSPHGNAGSAGNHTIQTSEIRQCKTL
jgi:hypothetical protein